MNTTLDANGNIPAPLDVALTTMVGGLLAGAVGANAQGAATAAQNETLNNWLNHLPPKPMSLSQADQYQQAAATGDGSTQDKLAALSLQNDQNLAQACANGPSAGCQVQIQAAQAGGNVVTMKPLGNGLYYTYANPLSGMAGPENFPFSYASGPQITALPSGPSLGAATLETMQGSPLAGAAAGLVYAFGGSNANAYPVAQLGAATDGIMAGLAGFQMPEAPTLVGGSGTSSVWNLSPFARGTAIEQALGQNLPQNFPVIDIFNNGMATSIKSLDVNASSYQSTSTLSNTITGYIDSVAGYNGTGPNGWAGVKIDPSQITGRGLNLVIPNAGSPAQQQAINQAVQYGLSKGVQVNVIIHP